MKPLQLKIQAFGPYVEMQTIDFEKLSENGISVSYTHLSRFQTTARQKSSAPHLFEYRFCGRGTASQFPHSSRRARAGDKWLHPDWKTQYLPA